MYKIVRDTNGVTGTLKDSNSHLDKTFTDSVAAELLAKKLNSNSKKNITYTVKQL
ncbi:hypothetical protein [Shouchella patagoniensis]|uniref:hypothetical protein n=1 Tax=Shouchella patagoniensis TaxID=228576 RepID=UPI001472A8C2|nr:hypothetical protein [Shouchella patagoniensis]